MIYKLKTLIIAREFTSRLPRVKGLGVVLALIANVFKRQNLPDVEVSVFGNKMLLNPNDRISNCLIFTPQWYDFKERKLIRKILNEGDYAIDIGANVGAYSLMFANFVGTIGKVIAIEAEEKNAKRLTHNIFINNINCIDVRNIGVSDRKETLVLMLNNDGNAGAHSFYKQSDPSSTLRQEILCQPLSEIIDITKKAKLMKLDVEGFEWRVLFQFFKDVPNFLWPDFILLEDDPRHREDDAVSLVVGHGYHIINRFDYNVFLAR